MSEAIGRDRCLQGERGNHPTPSREHAIQPCLDATQRCDIVDTSSTPTTTPANATATQRNSTPQTRAYIPSHTRTVPSLALPLAYLAPPDSESSLGHNHKHKQKTPRAFHHGGWVAIFCNRPFSRQDCSVSTENNRRDPAFRRETEH